MNTPLTANVCIVNGVLLAYVPPFVLHKPFAANVVRAMFRSLCLQPILILNILLVVYLFVAMSSQQLVADMTALHLFLEAQGQSEKAAANKQGQCTVLCNRISATALNCEVGAQLTKLVTGGPWLNTQKEALYNAINTAVTADPASAAAPVAAGSGSKMQRLKTWNNYLSRRLQIFVQDQSVSRDAKIRAFAQACWNIGLVHPEEGTVKHIVCVLTLVLCFVVYVCSSSEIVWQHQSLFGSIINLYM